MLKIVAESLVSTIQKQNLEEEWECKKHGEKKQMGFW